MSNNTLNKGAGKRSYGRKFFSTYDINCSNWYENHLAGKAKNKGEKVTGFVHSGYDNGDIIPSVARDVSDQYADGVIPKSKNRTGKLSKRLRTIEALMKARAVFYKLKGKTEAQVAEMKGLTLQIKLLTS